MTDYSYQILNKSQANLLDKYEPWTKKVKLSELMDQALAGGGRPQSGQIWYVDYSAAPLSTPDGSASAPFQTVEAANAVAQLYETICCKPPALVGGNPVPLSLFTIKGGITYKFEGVWAFDNGISFTGFPAAGVFDASIYSQINGLSAVWADTTLFDLSTEDVIVLTLDNCIFIDASPYAMFANLGNTTSDTMNVLDIGKMTRVGGSWFEPSSSNVVKILVGDNSSLEVGPTSTISNGDAEAIKIMAGRNQVMLSNMSYVSNSSNSHAAILMDVSATDAGLEILGSVRNEGDYHAVVSNCNGIGNTIKFGNTAILLASHSAGAYGFVKTGACSFYPATIGGDSWLLTDKTNTYINAGGTEYVVNMAYGSGNPNTALGGGPLPGPIGQGFCDIVTSKNYLFVDNVSGTSTPWLEI